MVVITTMLCLMLLPQQPQNQQNPPPKSAGLGVPMNTKTGWPEFGGSTQPVPDSARVTVTPVQKPEVQPPSVPAVEGSPAPVMASGADIGSPLLQVYERIGAPGLFRQLGGVTVWWRLTIYGQQGEEVGIRELTHTADLTRPDRDRIEFVNDGRVYGRSGATAYALRGSIPWPSLNEAAGQELELFGLLLRAPWCFGDSSSYTITARDYPKRDGQQFLRLCLERRLDGDERVGPELEPRARDRFELWCDPSGQPREFEHTLASSGQKRRVLLEDWQEKAPGVRIPCRRIYVDDDQRQTTVLELRRFEVTPVKDRDFRL